MLKKEEGKEQIYQTPDSERTQIRDHLVHWQDELNVAVLVDGDHNSSRLIGCMQSRAERLGALNLQRVYGNWSSTCLNGWEDVLIAHRLEPRHHGQVAVGKNATDITLVVDAMRLYYQGFRKFCIIASDSDYTPLVEFLCSEGCLVMVIGNAMTPLALKSACSVFIEISALQRPIASHIYSYSEKKAYAQVGRTSKDLSCSLGNEDSLNKMYDERLKAWLLKELTSYEPSPHAWVQVPDLRGHLVRSYDSFKPKTYGYKSFFVMLQAFPEVFQLRPYQDQKGIHEVRRVKTKLPG